MQTFYFKKVHAFIFFFILAGKRVNVSECVSDRHSVRMWVSVCTLYVCMHVCERDSIAHIDHWQVLGIPSIQTLMINAGAITKSGKYEDYEMQDEIFYSLF